MKGKLIKTDVNFLLEDDKGVVIASTSLKRVEGLSLSLKNCQEIERGYDLDELAKREYLDGYDTTELCRIAFKDGFQKALEIIGDKKFSEDDLRLAMHFGKFGEANNQTTTIGFIQSLQQTEWDVEILEECLDKNCDGINKKGECITTGIPKLDEEGCLILKKL